MNKDKIMRAIEERTFLEFVSWCYRHDIKYNRIVGAYGITLIDFQWKDIVFTMQYTEQGILINQYNYNVNKMVKS